MKLSLTVSTSPYVDIGRFTYGQPRFLLYDREASITIGAFCSIADGVSIFAGGEHHLDRVTTYPLEVLFEEVEVGHGGRSKGDVVIGNDVWIGYGAIILSGVTVGDGACIGAGAVVTKNVQPYSVVAGNPAACIRHRFPADQVEELLRLRWWDWDIERIRENADLLGGSPDELLKSFGRTVGS